MKMPKITRVAFVLGYVEIAGRLLLRAWTGYGSYVATLLVFGIMFAASHGQKWARIVWTFLYGLGIVKLLARIFALLPETGEMKGIALTVVVLSTVMAGVTLAALWHPVSSRWFDEMDV